MSLSDRPILRLVHTSALAVLGAAVLAGCQVRPLHGSAAGVLPAIEIKPADNRVEQVVRDEIIFKLSGGAGETVGAPYILDLRVGASNQNVLPTGTDNDFSAGRTVARGGYVLRKAETGEVVLEGRREATALVDLPSQDFARLRAVADAKERAARTLAAMIYADIAAKLAR